MRSSSGTSFETELAMTGLDPSMTTTLVFVAILALAIGIPLLIIRRRK